MRLLTVCVLFPCLAFLLITGCEKEKRGVAAPKEAPKEAAAQVKPERKAWKAELGSYQVIEGFADIVDFAHTRESYSDVRESAEGWWEYSRPKREEVTWETAVCPEQKPTIFVFWGQTGREEGTAKLLFNGEPALTFITGQEEDSDREGDGFELVKWSLGYADGHCGLYFLKVPKEKISGGKPCQITVSHIKGGGNSWFMIKNYKGNIAQIDVIEGD